MNKNSNKPALPPDNEDNAFFENYLQGKSKLSELYHKTGCPEPSDSLNQSILFAAKAVSKTIPEIKTHWWQQPASWAASVAVFSLVGILAYNTWQAEQMALEKDFLPGSATLQDQEQERISSSSPNRARTESDFQTGDSTKPLAQARKRIPQEEKNDSRKLLYKSEPAPAMPAAPKYMMRKQMAPAADEMKAPAQETMDASSNRQTFSDFGVPEKQQPGRVLQEQKTSTIHAQEQQLWLGKIKQFIAENKLHEARELMRQLKIKYPDHPIDPVILQHLSPY